MRNYRQLEEQLLRQKSLAKEMRRHSPQDPIARQTRRPFVLGENTSEDDMRKHMMIQLNRGFMIPLLSNRELHEEKLYSDPHMRIYLYVVRIEDVREVTISVMWKSEEHYTSLLSEALLAISWATRSVESNFNEEGDCTFDLDDISAPGQMQFAITPVTKGRGR